MKYLLILTLLLFIGCAQKKILPSCISDKGTTFVFVSADGKEYKDLNNTVKCL